MASPSSSIPMSPRTLQLDVPDSVLRQVRDHAMYLITPDARNASWNEGVGHILGWPEDDWLGQPAAVAFADDGVAGGGVDAELARAAAAGRADDGRWMKRRNGERFYAFGSITALRDRAGKVIGFLKVLRDDTAGRSTADEIERLLKSERRLHAEAERQSAMLRATIDAMPDAVFIGTADGISRCNQRALEQFGVPSTDLLKLPLAEFSRRFRFRAAREGEPTDSADLPFARALAGEPGESEFWITRPSGETVLLRSAAAPIRVDGHIVGAVAVNSDLTERRRMEEQRHGLSRIEARLQESEEAFRAIVSGVRDYAIFTVDVDARISSWHAGAQLMKGYTHDEAIGMPFADLFTPADRARGRPRHEMDIADRTGEYKGDGQRVRKGGEIFDVEVVLTPLRSPGGELLGFLKLTQDVTHRKRLETEREQMLRQAQAERAESERASHAMGELLATISHELRTPLSAILGWAHLLQRGLPTAEGVTQAIAAIMRNARIQVQLIEDLLDVSRIESGQMRLDLQPVDLASTIAGAVDAVVPNADLKRIRIQTVLDARAGRVMGDAARLQQVIWNLLSNAVKFTPVDGTVIIAVRRLARLIEIAVSDNGQGMAPDFVSRAFDRFQQQDGSSTRRHGGLGLGLTIVRELVDLHGGTVRAESAGPGEGSTFTVSLPAMHAGTPDMPAGEGDEPQPDPAQNQRLSGFALLLIDDEPDGRAVAAYALRAAGAEVVEAGSAEEGLDRFKERRPAAIICDLGMPAHDGFEFIGWVRRIDLAKGRMTPAAAFTAFARPGDRERALRAGYQVHLVKPMAPIALVEAVVELLQASLGDTVPKDEAL